MNTDVLECKGKAQELVTSRNPPFNRNGRRRVYIGAMKELWEEKGYGNLGLKSQNLRDQASRLEKNQDAVMETSATGQTVLHSTLSASNIDDNFISGEKAESSQDQNNVGKSSQNANQLILDLNMSAIQTPEECDHSTSKKVLNDAPGCLPNYEAISAPSTFVWGQHDDGRTITVSLSTIDNTYNEISKWRKNTCLVPYGK